MPEDCKIFKFVFKAFVQSVTLALKFPCVVSVIWKRGEKSSEVKQRKEIENGVVTFNQWLEIECNMSYKQSTKVFEEKKTKFSVLIFSERGNKLAGCVQYDVSEMLNSKLKEVVAEKSLKDCPDPKAKLKFKIVGELKEEIKKDQASKSSFGTTKALNAEVKLDFKKKKSPEKFELPQSPSKNVIVPVQVRDATTRLKLQEENKKLKSEMQSIRELKAENQKLKNKYQEGNKKAASYYKKKFEQTRQEYGVMREKAIKVKELKAKKEELEKRMCTEKQTIGNILNYALSVGDHQLAEQFLAIYQGQ